MRAVNGDGNRTVSMAVESVIGTTSTVGELLSSILMCFEGRVGFSPLLLKPSELNHQLESDAKKLLDLAEVVNVFAELLF